MKLVLFYYDCFILFSEQLCELVEEEDLELVTALVQWDFEDEMEDEDDEHGMFFVSSSNQGSTDHQNRTAPVLTGFRP